MLVLSRHCSDVSAKNPSYFQMVSISFHPIPVSWVPMVYPFMQEEVKKKYSVLYFSLTIPLPKGLCVLWVPTTAVLFSLLSAQETGLMKNAACMIQWQHTHPGSHVRNRECAGSACGNDLISVLPRRSRWKHRCADCPLSHGTAGPTHAILYYLSQHRTVNVHWH